jgi:hypothetical protein
MGWRLKGNANHQPRVSKAITDPYGTKQAQPHPTFQQTLIEGPLHTRKTTRPGHR